MITFYKEYMIQYNERPVQDSYSKQNERPKQIVVTSIVANGNFHCMYTQSSPSSAIIFIILRKRGLV